MAKSKFKRIKVKKVRNELRMEGQASTRKGKHFVKRYAVAPLEGRTAADLKKAQATAFAELNKD